MDDSNTPDVDQSEHRSPLGIAQPNPTQPISEVRRILLDKPKRCPNLRR
jgi:hypothetical protein